MSAATSRQFEITADSRVFREIWSDEVEAIARLPVAIWVKYPPTAKFNKTIIPCNCQVAFEFINSAANRKTLRSTGIRPENAINCALCNCYGRLIE